MKAFALTTALCALTGIAHADPCHDRFAELLVQGNDGMGPTLIHITQEIVGAQTTLTYHHSDGDGNGMSEAIDPPTFPWSLFTNGKMYMSTDKGQTWTFQMAFDGDKARADNRAAMLNDAASARDLACGREDLDGASVEVVEGTYTSSVIAGAEIFEKKWVDPATGYIVQSYSHVQAASYETKTTQLIQPHPDLDLPVPAK